MPIRWKALPIVEAMEVVQAKLNKARPFLIEAELAVKDASKGENLPQYITYKLARLDEQLGWCINSCERAKGGVLAELPEDAVKKERKRGGYDTKSML